MSLFTASGITVGYGRRNVLEDVSLSLEPGCLMGVLGANGCGKTTLLKAICGILPHGGHCQLEGTVLEDCSPRQLARLCSYIPQRSGITIDISTLDVVLMGFNPRLGLLEHPDRAMRQRAVQALAAVGLGGREEENYRQLSEGQKQLCILARTLISDSRMLLLDEPDSALDFHFRYQMLALLRQWLRERSSAAMVALHDGTLALNHCDQLLLLARGKALGVLHPRTDPLEDMEVLLSEIYGAVSLQRCRNRSGQDCLVMLKEDE